MVQVNPNRNNRKSNSEKTLLGLILALALVRGLLYGVIVPPWQAPDEPAQFERVRAALLAEEWASTAADAPDWYNELRDSLFMFRFMDFLFDHVSTEPGRPLNHYIVLYQEAYQGLYSSRLAYAVMGWPLYLFPNEDIITQLYLVRFYTVLMAAAVVLLAYLTAQIIFPNNTFLLVGVPIFILFIPQHTHLLSTVNNGNLTELLVTLAIFFMARGLMRGFSVWNIMGTIGFTLIAMWSKATAYFMLIPLSCLGLVLFWRFRRYWKWFLVVVVVISLVIYLFAPERLGLLISEATGRLAKGEFYLDPFVPNRIFSSFWAMPGWAIIWLRPLWYQLILAACLAAVIGLFKLVVTRGSRILSKPVTPQVQTLAILAVTVLAAGAIQLGWHILTGTLFYSQGRSLYPVIVPIAIFLLLGWQQFIPSRWERSALLVMGVTLFLFDSMVLFNYIIPFFYARY